MTQPGPDNESAFSALERLCRRICLLRVRGRSIEASQLHSTEFPRTVTELRARLGPESLSEEQVLAIFTRERERVADAAVLAELLGTFTPPTTSAVASVAASAEGVAGSTSAVPGLPSPRSASADGRFTPHASPATASPASAEEGTVPTTPAQAPAIADLLDEMLSHDSRRGRRSRDR